MTFTLFKIHTPDWEYWISTFQNISKYTVGTYKQYNLTSKFG